MALLFSEFLQLRAELCLHTLLKLGSVFGQSHLLLELVVFIHAHAVAAFQLLDLFFELCCLLVVLESKAVKLSVFGEKPLL
jgi:hypothetical protein